jgi:hypothetical protein
MVRNLGFFISAVIYYQVNPFLLVSLQALWLNTEHRSVPSPHGGRPGSGQPSRAHPDVPA